MTYAMNMKEVLWHVCDKLVSFAQLWHFLCKYDIGWDVFVM